MIMIVDVYLNDKWMLSNALWIKFYINHDKYKFELNEYFYIYRSQLNFPMFSITSSLGISWQRFIHPHMLVHSVYRFQVYFYVRITLYHLVIFLPHEDGFSKVKNSYLKSAYYSISNNYSVNADETWMHRYCFYTTKYGIFGDGRKTTNRSPTDNLKW